MKGRIIEIKKDFDGVTDLAILSNRTRFTFDEINVWSWEQGISDWVTSEGELLTGCNASRKYEVRIE